MSTPDRSLPQAPEAETAILGGILLDPALIAEAANTISPDDFYSRSNRAVYLAMLGLFDRSEGITPISIAGELRQAETLAMVGGVSALTQLIVGLPRFSSLKSYTEALKRSTRRRQIIRLGNEIATRGMDSDESEDALLSWLDERAMLLRSGREDKRGPKWIAELMDAQMARFERFHRRVQEAVPTGIPEIDSHLTGGGLGYGMPHILAARPSMGKTSLALDIGINAANAGFCVYVATIEMLNPVLLDRVFSVASGVERRRLSPGLSNLELDQLRGVRPDLEKLPFILDDRSRSITQIRRGLREVERVRKVDLIILDYLQLMNTEKGGSRNDQVGANSRGFQELCKEFGAAGLLLSQLNRDMEKTDREPEMRDLRDSGEIEQDARAIFFLFGDKAEEGPDGYTPTFREVTFKCAKQGEGPLFRVDLPFNTKLMTFRGTERAIVTPMNVDADSDWES